MSETGEVRPALSAAVGDRQRRSLIQAASPSRER